MALFTSRHELIVGLARTVAREVLVFGDRLTPFAEIGRRLTRRWSDRGRSHRLPFLSSARDIAEFHAHSAQQHAGVWPQLGCWPLTISSRTVALRKRPSQ